MSRPTTGDKVKIISLPDSIDDRADLIGEIGEIVIDDHTAQPYCIRVNTESFWFYEHNVELVEEAPAPQKPKRQLKPGDKVRVKSREWYEANKDCVGSVDVHLIFVGSMAEYCGKTFEIESIERDGIIRLKGLDWNWSIDMFDLDDPQEKSSSMQAFIDSADGLRNLIHRGSKPVFKEKLPLIKTNKLLTNIKLD